MELVEVMKAISRLVPKNPPRSFSTYSLSLPIGFPVAEDPKDNNDTVGEAKVTKFSDFFFFFFCHSGIIP